MAPFGSRALLAVPVRREDQTVGAVSVEDTPQDPVHLLHAADFVRALANMLALRMTQVPAALARERADPALERAEAGEVHSFSADLKAEGIDPAALKPTSFFDGRNWEEAQAARQK